jgi:hypothetical protein
VKIPLGIFFHPDLLSPNHCRRLFKHHSGDSLAAGIPGSRRSVLFSVWGFLSSTWVSPWTMVTLVLIRVMISVAVLLFASGTFGSLMKEFLKMSM